MLQMMEEFYQKRLLIVMTLLIDTKILYAERRCSILICQQKMIRRFYTQNADVQS